MPGHEPSAEELQDRIDKMGKQQDSGAGNKEPDPATAANPPEERREGDQSRRPD